MPTKISVTGGLINVLDIAVGARVMLTYNINTSDGLVNGVMGVVVNVIEKLRTVTTILVEFDNDVVGLQAKNQNHYKNEHPNAVPICRHEANFGIGKRKTTEVPHGQFLLVLAWASTIHKVQGMTVNDTVVSMKGKVMPGQAYVALSRVKQLEGLYIKPFDEKKIKANEKVEKHE